MSTPPRPPHDTPRPLGPLAAGVVALANTPDDASDIDTRFAPIAQLVADTLIPVSYAAITAVRDGDNTTVAATSELATAVDKAQYADDSGPRLDALHDGTSVGVDDIAATMSWPGFRPALADSSYERTGQGIKTPVKQPTDGKPLAADNRAYNRAYNRLLRGLRWQGERGFAIFIDAGKSCVTPRSAHAGSATSSPPRCT